MNTVNPLDKYLSKILFFAGRSYKDMAWEDLTLENSWVHFGAPKAVPAYHMDVFGWVHIKGGIKDGTSADGTTVATLPEGFRPYEEVRCAQNIPGPSVCLIYISTDGTIKGTGMSSTLTSLDGIRFRTY